MDITVIILNSTEQNQLLPNLKKFLDLYFYSGSNKWPVVLILCLSFINKGP